MWRMPTEKMWSVSYILWASSKGKDTAMTEVLVLMDESEQTAKPGLSSHFLGDKALYVKERKLSSL